MYIAYYQKCGDICDIWHSLSNSFDFKVGGAMQMRQEKIRFKIFIEKKHGAYSCKGF